MRIDAAPPFCIWNGQAIGLLTTFAQPPLLHAMLEPSVPDLIREVRVPDLATGQSADTCLNDAFSAFWPELV